MHTQCDFAASGHTNILPRCQTDALQTSELLSNLGRPKVCEGARIKRPKLATLEAAISRLHKEEDRMHRAMNAENTRVRDIRKSPVGKISELHMSSEMPLL